MVGRGIRYGQGRRVGEGKEHKVQMAEKVIRVDDIDGSADNDTSSARITAWAAPGTTSPRA